ncbi:MAG: flavodoxin family protein [Oscillospiraceae bacterium]
MKMAVLYHSKTGNTRQMADAIAQGMRSVAGAEVQTFSIDAVDVDYVKECRCVVIGGPIYYATISAELKVWLDGASVKCGLKNKLGGAFATADYLHGGAELGIRTILDHMMVLGMLTYSGGGAFGAPVIHLGPVALKEHLDQSREVFETYGQRMAGKALELFG